MTQLQRLTEHVYALPTHPDKSRVEPAVGVVVTENHTVLYDAGNTPAHAHHLLDELRAISAPPVSLVIYSHYHWDHIFGAMVYDAPVLVHDLCRQHVKQYALRPWGPEYLSRRAEEQPQIAPVYQWISQAVDWDTFRIVMPTQTFTERVHRLEIDGVTLELELVGGWHAEDSTILRVVDERVMFLSDSFYPQFGKAGGNLEMVQRFLDEGYDYYVDGHNEIFTHESFTAWLNSPLRTRVPQR